MANIPAEPLVPVWGISGCKGTAFSTPPVICNYYILNVIGQHEYWYIGKIRIQQCTSRHELFNIELPCTSVLSSTRTVPVQSHLITNNFCQIFTMNNLKKYDTFCVCTVHVMYMILWCIDLLPPW
jgi:hypothetical protein